MNVVFLVVDCFTRVQLLHLLEANTGVLDVAVDGEVRVALVGDGLEESRATRVGTTEDETHFSWAENTGLGLKNSTGLGGERLETEEAEDEEDRGKNLLDDGVDECTDVDLDTTSANDLEKSVS